MKPFWKPLALVEAALLLALGSYALFSREPSRPKSLSDSKSSTLPRTSQKETPPKLQAPPPKPNAVEATARRPSALRSPGSEPSPTPAIKDLGFVILGRVLGDDGKGIPRVKKHLWWLEGTKRYWSPNRSRDGSYSMVGLPPGSYKIELGSKGYLPIVRHIRLEGPPQILRRDFRLPKARVVEISLKSNKGRPVFKVFQEHYPKSYPGAFVREVALVATKGPLPSRLPPSSSPKPVIRGALYTRFQNRPDGRSSPFYFGTFDLPSGVPYWIHLFRRNLKIWSKPLPLHAKKLTLEFDEDSLFKGAGKVRLRVLDRDSQKEIPGLRILIFDQGQATSTLPLSWTHNQGVWETSPFPGVYQVQVSKKGMGTVTRSVRVLSGQTTDLGTITLEKSYDGFLKILWPDQKPFRGICYVLRLDTIQKGLPAPPSRFTIVKEKGLPLSYLGRGVYRLLINIKGYRLNKILDLRDGLPKDLVLHLENSKRPQARFVIHLPPQPPLLFSLYDPDGYLYTNWSRYANGWDRTFHLNPGLYTLYVHDHFGKQLRKLPIRVRPGRENRFEIK